MATWDAVPDSRWHCRRRLREPREKASRTLVWSGRCGEQTSLALDDAAPQGPILGVRMPDLGAKEELLVEVWLSRASKAMPPSRPCEQTTA
jgi:hypothetical protein